VRDGSAAAEGSDKEVVDLVVLQANAFFNHVANQLLLIVLIEHHLGSNFSAETTQVFASGIDQVDFEPAARNFLLSVGAEEIAEEIGFLFRIESNDVLGDLVFVAQPCDQMLGGNGEFFRLIGFIQDEHAVHGLHLDQPLDDGAGLGAFIGKAVSTQSNKARYRAPWSPLRRLRHRMGR
jgi:hypothetical protein